MKLILVRHGETVANSKKIIQGKIGGNLTKKGIKQAREVGKQLKEKHKIDMVFCSPLNRCVETLENILSEYPIESEIFMSKLIEERGFGEYEGVEDYMINWDEMDEDSRETREMGVESWNEIEKRVRLFLEDLKLEDNNKTVLVITHGGPIRVILSELSGKRYKYGEVEVKNGQIFEFDYKTDLKY